MTRMAMAVAVALGMSCVATPGASARDRSGDEADLAMREPGPASSSPARRYTVQRPSAPPARIDADGDGTISRDEARRYYDWIFGVLDLDGDGTVEEAEFVAALAPSRRGIDPTRSAARLARVSSLFQRLDGDADRSLVAAEFVRACDAHFATSDGDGDGEVSAHEFASRRPL